MERDLTMERDSGTAHACGRGGGNRAAAVSFATAVPPFIAPPLEETAPGPCLARRQDAVFWPGGRR